MYMKKTLSFVFCLSVFSSFAQQGVFLQPTIGVGLGNVKYKQPSGEPFKSQFAVVHNEVIGIGYQFKRLFLNTGLGYNRSGFTQEYYYTTSENGPSGLAHTTQFFNQVIMPLLAGYRFGNKCHISPVAGAAITYNYSATIVEADYFKTIWHLENNEFKSQYKPISVLAVVGLNIEYPVSARLGIVLAPKADYMVTEIFKRSYTSSSMHPYSFMLNAGIKWNLAKDKNRLKQAAE